VRTDAPLGTAEPHIKWSPQMQLKQVEEFEFGAPRAARAACSAARSADGWERSIGMAVLRGAVGFPPAHRDSLDGRSDNG
jgi:hypothetical protein